MRGGVVAPGSLKFDRAKFMEVSAEAVVAGKTHGVIVDELHEIKRDQGVGGTVTCVTQSQTPDIHGRRSRVIQTEGLG